jgi:hypothetical protein
MEKEKTRKQEFSGSISHVAISPFHHFAVVKNGGERGI